MSAHSFLRRSNHIPSILFSHGTAARIVRAMLLYAVILIAVLGTSMLSGVLGMAGGMILMALLVALLPVAVAMMLHGAVQAFSNGSRAWFLREYVRWKILPFYLVGAAIAVAAFAMLTLVPDPAVVLLLVGAMPWIARATPHIGNRLDATRRVTGAICGVTVTSAQLLAGASGPLLDLFYLKTPLTRHEVVATKALTQTVGHLLKLVYYGLITASAANATTSEIVPAWLYVVAIATAVAGARIGTRLLDRMANDHFRRVSGWVILGLGAVSMVEGARQLVSA
jgi:uncharacterized membrane protein YfcA